MYNVGKIKESVSPSAKVIAVVGSKPLGKTLSNTIIHNSAKKSTGKFSLSPIAPETSPGGTLKITSDDVTLKAPKVEAEAKTENVLDDDIPIRKEPTLAELKAERDIIESIAEAVYVQNMQTER